jgi:hypothetical protein
MLFLVYGIVQVISLAALLINFFTDYKVRYEQYQDDDYDYAADFYNRTTITNMDDLSSSNYFHVFASFLLPYLVYATVYFCLPYMSTYCNTNYTYCITYCSPYCNIDPGTTSRSPIPPPSSLASTLVVHGLEPALHPAADIRDHFRTQYPGAGLRTITWAKDTRHLRRLLEQVSWAREVARDLRDPALPFWLCGAHCRARDLAWWEGREQELVLAARREQEAVLAGPPLPILFLTMESPRQAGTVQLLEAHRGSTYSSIELAPPPDQVAWQNMKSRVATSLHLPSSVPPAGRSRLHLPLLLTPHRHQSDRPVALGLLRHCQ